MNPELEYCLRRACQELFQATHAEHPKAAHAHADLSSRYVGRARRLLRRV